MAYKIRAADLGRLSVRQLQARRRRAAARVGDPELFLRGALQEQGRRCGKQGCRCARGELHGPYVYLAVAGPGRTRLLYVPAALVRLVRVRLRQTGRVDAALDEIAAVNAELLRRQELD